MVGLHRLFTLETRILRQPGIDVGVLAAFVLVLALASASAACAPPASQENPGKPNIVLILTDDMRLDELEHMPKTQNLIVDQGVEYSNAFVTTPRCCPSRASILRGQYVHNHQVLTNSGRNGGFAKFESQGHEDSTVATWLHEAGYKSVLIGKYLNGLGIVTV